MSNESYVSNGGVVVSVYDEGLSGTGEGPIGIEIGSALDVALATHYQQRRDKGLGVWRNPERPNEIVYPLEVGRVIVLNETSGWTGTWERKHVDRDAYVDHFGFDTAHAYFTTISKPWHEAKPGEVWAIEVVNYGTSACTVTEDDFIEITGLFGVAIPSSTIKSGYRVWPADD